MITINNIDYDESQEIHYYIDGSICSGVLNSDQTIATFPCKGNTDICFMENGTLQLFTLFTNHTIQGITFPINSRVLLDGLGNIQYVALSQDTIIAGINYKNNTFIHFDYLNQVSIGIIAEDAIITGYPCKTNTLVVFHSPTQLAQFTLSIEHTINSVLYPANKIIELYLNDSLKTVK